MSYGLEILTTEGLSSAENIVSAQLVHSQRILGISGSITVPDYDSSIGFMYVVKNVWEVPSTNNGITTYVPRFLPLFSFNNTTKVFSWYTKGAAWNVWTCDDNTVFFMRVY